ncbi:MAG TPA: hypothetical protein VFN05_13980 [Actinomycetes bacterium]|nr:hypothetical protein [Actinomycetes bacterium]
MRALWPVGEAAQADYETLRAAVLAGTPLLGAAAARFERCGLAGLITHPTAEPTFTATLRGAHRPAWSPHADPRVDALAAGYQLILTATGGLVLAKEANP